MSAYKKASTAVIVALAVSLGAHAATKVTTIESNAVIEDIGPRAVERVVTITGPDRNAYRIQASPAEVERIVTLVRADPNARISFTGETIDMDGNRVFRVNEWRQVERTTTTTTTDQFGNRHTETQTETQIVK